MNDIHSWVFFYSVLSRTAGRSNAFRFANASAGEHVAGNLGLLQ